MRTTRQQLEPLADLHPADQIEVDAWRERILPALEMPHEWHVDDVRIARVYPGRPDGVGVQAELILTRRNGARALGSLYLTHGMRPRGRGSRRLRVRAGAAFTLTGVACRPARCDWALHSADRDDTLTHVVDASRSAAAQTRLDALMPETHVQRGQRWQCTLANYRPRRRCTLLYRRGPATSQDFVVGKMFRGGKAAEHALVARRLHAALKRQTDGRVVAPRVLDVWPDWNMVAFEGLAAAGARTAAFDAADMSLAAAEALARLHTLKVAALPAFAARDELAATRRWVDLARRVDRLTPRAARLWSLLSDSPPPDAGAGPVVLHRDFHASQILPLGERLGLVDFDTAALGDAEQDVANYIGHLALDVELAGHPFDILRHETHRFLDHYVCVRRRLDVRPRRGRLHVDAARLRFYLLSSLLRVGIIHELRTDTRRRAGRLHRLASERIEDWLATDRPRRLCAAAV